MSGLVQWSSKAKRKGVNKKAGSALNPHKSRALASRKRKATERNAKLAQRQRRVEIAAKMAE